MTEAPPRPDPPKVSNSSTRTSLPEPLPRDPLGQRLCELFPYFWQTIVGVNEPDPNWQTITQYPLRPRVLWQMWQDAAQLVGVRFGNQTQYALIDLDHGSPYHPQQTPGELLKIRLALETIGIYRTLLIRSSWSEGLHLYIPLPETVPTFGLASALKQCLQAQGLTIAPGKLEIFPNCKAYAKPGSFTEYNAHRLPLQPASGSCLLDDDGNPTSQDLARFFQQWDTAAIGQDMAELRQAIATAKRNRRGKPHRQSTVIEEWVQDLRTEMEEGWTGYGQTNHLLKTIACYGVVFKGLQGEELADYVLRTAIALPGYAEWCRHQYEIQVRTAVWARAAEGYYWPLGETPLRSRQLPEDAENNIVPINRRRSEDAQQRIREAVVQLEAAGQLPATATARAIAIADQGISTKTLYRYQELWHPKLVTEGLAPLLAAPLVEPIIELCKIADSEPITASLDAKLAEPPEPPEPMQDREFYTCQGNMKGCCSDSDVSNFISSLPGEAPPRDSFTESVTFNHGMNASKPLLDQELSNSTVTATSFPQVATPGFDRGLIEKFCDRALAIGQSLADKVRQRVFVLERLQHWWISGWQAEVEELCQNRQDWGFLVRKEGVVDGTT